MISVLLLFFFRWKVQALLLKANAHITVLKARVVAAEASPRQYKGNDGADKSSLTSAISDGETVMKVVCYNSTKFAKLKVRTTKGNFLKKVVSIEFKFGRIEKG